MKTNSKSNRQLSSTDDNNISSSFEFDQTDRASRSDRLTAVRNLQHPGQMLSSLRNTSDLSHITEKNEHQMVMASSENMNVSVPPNPLSTNSVAQGPNSILMQLAVSKLLNDQLSNGNVSLGSLLGMDSSTLQQQLQQQKLQQIQQSQTNINNPLLPITSLPHQLVQFRSESRSTLESSTDQSDNQLSSTKTATGSSSDTSRSFVPCRARGESMEHNFQTAFFEITHKTKHGDGLICSFPECRNKGIKFLYCAYCKDPIAKRNFRKQHTHAEQFGKNTDATLSTRGTDKKSAGSNGPPVATVVPKKKKRKISSNSAANGKPPHEVSETSNKGEATTTGTSSSNTNSSFSNSEKDVEQIKKELKDKQKLETVDAERRLAWEKLLVSRPGTDSEEMSLWLMKVMSVSDLKKSTKVALKDPENSSLPQESSETSSISRTTQSTGDDKSTNDDGTKQSESGERVSNDADGDSDW